MVAVSTSFFGECNTSCASSDSSLKTPTKSSASVEDALKCYVCEGYFTKPRILPCGHTYCSSCLLQLRESAVHEFNKSRDVNAHRRGECGFFTCPWPNCHYSMKIMNVWRWTLRNKAVTKAVAIAKKKDTQVMTYPGNFVLYVHVFTSNPMILIGSLLAPFSITTTTTTTCTSATGPGFQNKI